MPLFQLQNAFVQRAGKEILHVDFLQLAEGESVAILGPNGSGKSTFVGLLTREVLPLHQDEPPVLFRGNARATLEEIKQHVGFVSASMQKQIYVHVPAVQIVEGGLFGSLGRPMRIAVSREESERALGAMEELGIADLAGRDVTTLSTGQARRVLIARALVHDPSILVFDEPCTGLDPEGMYYVRKAMSMVAGFGRSVVLVTHYPEDIVREIDRVILLKDGQIVGDGIKRETLTTEHMQSLFNVPVQIKEDDGIFRLIS